MIAQDRYQRTGKDLAHVINEHEEINKDERILIDWPKKLRWATLRSLIHTLLTFHAMGMMRDPVQYQEWSFQT